MNKGMILELKGETAIVLTPEGEFRSIAQKKQQRWQIGEEVDLPPARGEVPQLKRKKRVFIPSIALAASLLLVIVSIFSFLPFGGDQTAVAYVNVDINPSVEISINKSLEVIDLVGLNQEGKQIVSIMEDWSREPLDQVTTNMIMIARLQGFLTENQDVLVSTSFVDEESESLYVSSVDSALDEVEKKVEQESEVVENESTSNASADKGTDQTNVQSQTTDHKKKTSIKIHQLKTKTEIRNEANEKGMSSGKYSIYLKAVEQGVEIDIKEVADSTISELAQKLNGLDSILSNKPSGKNNDKDNSNEGENDNEDDMNDESRNNKENGNSKKDRVILGRDQGDDEEDEQKLDTNPKANGKQKGKKDKVKDEVKEDRDRDEDEDKDDDDKKKGKSDQGNKDDKGPPHKDKAKNNSKHREDSENQSEVELEFQHPKIPGILNQVPGLIHDGKEDKQRGNGGSGRDKEREDEEDSEEHNKGNKENAKEKYKD
jgi:hypothetical protein